MLKLLYFTRARLPSNAAQSSQIMSMLKAFNRNQAVSLKAIVGAGEPSDDDFFREIEEIDMLSIAPISIKLLNKIFSIIYLVRELSKQKVDVIYTRDIAAALIGCVFHVPTVYEAHKEPKGVVATLLTKMFARSNQSGFVFISNALGEFYAKRYFNENKPICIAHDGVFLEQYYHSSELSKADLRSELVLPVDKIIVGHTGSIHQGRGAELFGAILRDFPDLLFVQVGGKDEDIEYWKQQYKEYSNILFTGFVRKDVLSKYQMAFDALVLPMNTKSDIWWCTSPMKAFEYLASGTPILASNIGSLGEVLNEDNCFLFDAESKSSLVNGLSKLLDQPGLAQSKARNGKLLVESQYTWEIRARKIISYLSELTGKTFSD